MITIVIIYIYFLGETMENQFNILFQYFLNEFGTEHLFTIFYVLNLIFSIIAYKLGFARKISLLKSFFVYVLLAIGVYVITIFSVFGLAMTESLIIITIVLAIYRFRLYRERKAKNNSDET